MKKVALDDGAARAERARKAAETAGSTPARAPAAQVVVTTPAPWELDTRDRHERESKQQLIAIARELVDPHATAAAVRTTGLGFDVTDSAVKGNRLRPEGLGFGIETQRVKTVDGEMVKLTFPGIQTDRLAVADSNTGTEYVFEWNPTEENSTVLLPAGFPYDLSVVAGGKRQWPNAGEVSVNVLGQLELKKPFQPRFEKGYDPADA